MEEIKEITPIPQGKGGKWRSIKNRRTRFINKLKSISGVNEDLMGPYQPERSKREDVFVLQGSKECIAQDAIPSKECKEYHENSYIQINGKLRRCGTLNIVETQ